MLRINKQGFTLIELMVVIVIIGVLASLAIPRFTEASSKAKMQEAPRIIASYESGYLAAIAEKGTVESEADLVVKIDNNSKWFNYTFADVGTNYKAGQLTASAKSDIGKFANGNALVTTYTVGTAADEDDSKFCRTVTGATKAIVEKLAPSFAESIDACN